MAALDLFESYLSGLSPQELENVKDLIRYQREDLFAARSEEARERMVEEFVKQVHDRIRIARR